MFYRISLGSPIPSDGNFKLTSRLPPDGMVSSNILVFDCGLGCWIIIQIVHLHQGNSAKDVRRGCWRSRLPLATSLALGIMLRGIELNKSSSAENFGGLYIVYNNVFGFEPRGVRSTSLNKTSKMEGTARGKCGVHVG